MDFGWGGFIAPMQTAAGVAMQDWAESAGGGRKSRSLWVVSAWAVGI